MTVPESSIPVITTAVTPTSTSTKVHSFVRQTPVTSTSFQATQGEDGNGENNGRVSVQPTAFEGGLLVGLYDRKLGLSAWRMFCVRTFFRIFPSRDLW